MNTPGNFWDKPDAEKTHDHAHQINKMIDGILSISPEEHKKIVMQSLSNRTDEQIIAHYREVV
jgi:hypothetical protein